MRHQFLIKKALISAIAPLAIILSPLAAQAQTSSDDPSSVEIEYRALIDLNKAKNLARQAAEKANGGLSQYRAEPAMHGPAQQTNYQQLADGVWQFNFQGRRPTSSQYTIESVVVVDTNTGEITVEYNGPIRE